MAGETGGRASGRLPTARGSFFGNCVHLALSVSLPPAPAATLAKPCRDSRALGWLRELRWPGGHPRPGTERMRGEEWEREGLGSERERELGVWTEPSMGPESAAVIH